MVGVLLENPKTPYNVGSVIRAMAVFEGDRIRWTGERVLDPKQVRSRSVVLSAKRHRFPREERMRGWEYIDWRASERDHPLDDFEGFTPVCVEVLAGSEALFDFEHPKHAVYVFGPEDGGVSKGVRARCHRFVTIPSRHCLNLAAAVNVVLYDRMAKRVRQADQLREVLGV